MRNTLRFFGSKKEGTAKNTLRSYVTKTGDTGKGIGKNWPRLNGKSIARHTSRDPATSKNSNSTCWRRNAPWGSPQVLKVNGRRMPSATTTSNESRRHSHHVEWTLFILIIRQDLKWQFFVNKFLWKFELNTGYFFSNNKLSVRVHVLPRCIGALQTLLYLLFFSVTDGWLEEGVPFDTSHHGNSVKKNWKSTATLLAICVVRGGGSPFGIRKGCWEK